MKISPLACNCCDDLMMYARQIGALGRVVEQLAAIDSESLEEIGQEIGYLITDLSKLMEAELKALYWPIEGIYNGKVLKDPKKGASAKVDRQTEAPKAD